MLCDRSYVQISEPTEPSKCQKVLNSIMFLAFVFIGISLYYIIKYRIEDNTGQFYFWTCVLVLFIVIFIATNIIKCCAE